MAEHDPWYEGFDLDAKRAELAALAANAPENRLLTLAELHDVLDMIDAGRAGEVEPVEVMSAMKKMHKRLAPKHSITWTAIETDQWGRSWTSHMADITDSQLVEMRPLPPQFLAQLGVEHERLWVHTTGDPDEADNFDKMAFVWGVSRRGQVLIAAVCSEDTDPDDPEASVAFAQVAIQVPLRAARVLRDNLSAAIREASKVSDRLMVAQRERYAGHLVETHGMSAEFAATVASAAAESALSGMPQTVVDDSGVAHTIYVLPDGRVELDYEGPTPGGEAR